MVGLLILALLLVLLFGGLGFYASPLFFIGLVLAVLFLVGGGVYGGRGRGWY
jgi:hypothetical protein